MKIRRWTAATRGGIGVMTFIAYALPAMLDMGFPGHSSLGRPECRPIGPLPQQNCCAGRGAQRRALSRAGADWNRAAAPLPSRPGLARPSTTSPTVESKKVVDDRHKAGHDG